MERMFRVLEGLIPKDFYFADIKHGQESGLIITLTGKSNIVEFDFGNADAVRIIDEGIVNIFFPNIDCSKEIKCGFENVIYEIKGDAFSDEICEMSGGILTEKEIKHYYIVTFLYVIDIVGRYVDEGFYITINGIRYYSEDYNK